MDLRFPPGWQAYEELSSKRRARPAQNPIFQLAGSDEKLGLHFSNPIFHDGITLWTKIDSNHMYRT